MTKWSDSQSDLSSIFMRVTSLFFSYFDAIHEMKEIPVQLGNDFYQIFDPVALQVIEKKENQEQLILILGETSPLPTVQWIQFPFFKTMDNKEFWFSFAFPENETPSFFKNQGFLEWIFNISQYLYGLMIFFEEIQKVRIFFQNIIDTLPEILIVFNQNNMISEWRDNTSLTGYSSKSMTGKKITDLIKGIDLEPIKSKLGSCQKPSEILKTIREVEGLVMCSDGWVKEMEFSFSYFTDDSNIQYYIALGKDISENKALQRQLKARNNELENFYRHHTKELKFASLLQKKMMKNQEREIQGIFCTTYYIPFEFVGGDYLSVLPVKDRVYFIIADVVGHGVFSAFYSAMLHSSFNNLVFYPDEIEDFIAHVYREFTEIMEYDNYLTLIMGYVDQKEKIVSFANYGHPYPVFYQESEKNAVLLSHQHNRILSPIVPFEKPKMIQVPFKKGDKLFLYSDGLIEQEKQKKDKFEKFRLFLEENSGKFRGKQLVSEIFTQICLDLGHSSCPVDFFHLDPQTTKESLNFDDDVSLLILEF